MDLLPPPTGGYAGYMSIMSSYYRLTLLSCNLYPARYCVAKPNFRTMPRHRVQVSNVQLRAVTSCRAAAICACDNAAQSGLRQQRRRPRPKKDRYEFAHRYGEEERHTRNHLTPRHFHYATIPY